MKRPMRFTVPGFIVACVALALTGCGPSSDDEVTAPQSAPPSSAPSTVAPSSTPSAKPTPSETPYETSLVDPVLKKDKSGTRHTVGGKKHTCVSFLTGADPDKGGGCVFFMQGSWAYYGGNFDSYLKAVDKGTYGRGIQAFSRPELAFASIYACAASYGNKDAQAVYATDDQVRRVIKEKVEFLNEVWHVAHAGLCPKKGVNVKAVKVNTMPYYRAALINGRWLSCGDFRFPGKERAACVAEDQALWNKWSGNIGKFVDYAQSQKADPSIRTKKQKELGTLVNFGLQACEAKSKKSYVAQKAEEFGSHDYDEYFGIIYSEAQKHLC